MLRKTRFYRNMKINRMGGFEVDRINQDLFHKSIFKDAGAKRETGFILTFKKDLIPVEKVGRAATVITFVQVSRAGINKFGEKWL